MGERGSKEGGELEISDSQTRLSPNPPPSPPPKHQGLVNFVLHFSTPGQCFFMLNQGR